MALFELGGSLSGGSEKSKYNESTRIDDWLRKRQEAMLASAEGDLASRYSPTSAAQIAAQMNPFTQQVIDRLDASAGAGRRQALNEVADRAGAAGAFGGSRHGVAEGVALGEFDRNRADQTAGLVHEGFREAADRALDENRFGYAYPMQRYGVLGDLLARITPTTTTTGSKKTRTTDWSLSGKATF